MKILICGLGSIGQRHARLLRQVGGKGLQLSCFRARGLDLVISDRLTADKGVSPEKLYGLTRFDDLALALADRPDAVFVTNPISMHVETALAAARAGAHVFVEKPLGHSRKNLIELRQALAERSLVGMVGYQLRFHPAIQIIKDELENGAIGRLVSAEFHFGEWLPGMHPYEDYRESHAARQDQGGGVILCLSHEIDIAMWLVGRPNRVYCVGGHLSNLELDGVEDTAVITMSCDVEGRTIPVTVGLDFLQKPPRRFLHLVGESGVIHWDYYDNLVIVEEAAGGLKRIHEFPGFARNAMFEAEIRNFLDAIQGRGNVRIAIEDGIAATEVCLAARDSMNSGRAIDL
ncbi:MAG: Gfo/Idh/MocA family oxidoreductase [Alphaproteobacteria bacterium]